MMLFAKRHSPWFVSGLLCGLILLVFAAVEAARGSDDFLHWFLIPLTLCGIVIGYDAARWATGEVDIFDPAGLLGLFGLHFFFLAPLLHIHWNYWIDEVNPPPDWRDWLGAMAMLNFVSLLAYRWALARADAFWQTSRQRSPRGSRGMAWRLQPRFKWLLGGALLLGVVAQLWIYSQYGGLSGMFSAVERRDQAFLGSGRIGSISGNFPFLALMGYAVYLRKRGKHPGWLVLSGVLVLFAAVKMLFGGLTGSRTDVVWTMFWGVGVIHFGIRPISRKFVLAGIVALVVFMNLYGIYKSAGISGLQMSLESSQSRANVVGKTGRKIESTILDDLGRSDVQAYELYRLAQPDCDYHYAWGRTYWGALLTPIPGPLWRDRPPGKVKEGTEILRGAGSYRERPLNSVYEKDKFVGMTSRLFGIGGEALINFGPWGVPLAMGLFGLFVGRVRGWMRAWHSRDARRFLLPILANLCIVILANDSDNVLWFLGTPCLLPFFILFLSSRIVRRSAAAAFQMAGRRPLRVGLEGAT